MSMSTMRALALLGAAAACATATDLPVALEEAALDADDACSADPTGDGCATALLQLRGAQRVEEVSALNTTGGAGFCCFAGSNDADVCGSCYPSSKAKADSYCNNEGHCGGCGGSWCTRQCVFSYSDDDNKCGSATSVAEPGNWCASSEEKCLGCGDAFAWCVKPAEAPSASGPTVEPTSAPADAPAPSEGGAAEDGEESTEGEGDEASTEGEGDEAEEGEEDTAGADHHYGIGGGGGFWGGSSLLEEANASAAAGASRGFCCFSGDGNDKCGSCYPDAKAEKGSFCDSEEQCGTCSETAVWCTEQCVFASSDPDDVCNTAYESAVADSDNWCAQSDTRCESENCNGIWCGVTKAKVVAKN